MSFRKRRRRLLLPAQNLKHARNGHRATRILQSACGRASSRLRSAFAESYPLLYLLLDCTGHTGTRSKQSCDGMFRMRARQPRESRFLRSDATLPATSNRRQTPGRALRRHGIDVAFAGALRDRQPEAVDKVLEHDEGILCAGTAFGKTAAAAYLMAARKRNTLVLVHRAQLLD